MKKLFLLLLFILGITIVNFLPAEAKIYNDKKIFPGWNKDKKHLKGVLGKNGGSIDTLAKKGEKQGILLFFPKITNIILYSVTAFIIVFLFWGGFKLVVAQGNDEEMKKAKQIITNCLIGFVIAVSAYTVVRLTYEIIRDKGNPEASNTPVSVIV